MSSTELSAPGETAALPNAAGSTAISEVDRIALRGAVEALERSTLAGRLSRLAGRPIELVGQALPESARQIVTGAVEAALRAALRVALASLPKGDGARWAEGRAHTAMSAVSGALGGALGLATLPLELPVSTTLMLRAIAAIAREEGEDLLDPAVALECLQVFALGSHADSDDLATSGYLAVRGVLARSVAEAARLATGQALADASAPAIVRLVATVANRFGIVVSQKVAAAAVPLIGALGGAAVNVAFTEHFRAVARAHFVVRRLERHYGAPVVQAAYEELRSQLH